MSLVAAVEKVGPIPDATARQDVKKRYSEVLSANLAAEVADGLAGLGFRDVRPGPGGHGEREFQGGLGPKRVDVSYSDHRHGLILAVSIKTICFAPFSKNLKNRFADLCTEAVSLHLRFPYAVICGLFAFPMAADRDHEDGRALSTFRRSLRLFGTIGLPVRPVQLVSAGGEEEVLGEVQYLRRLRFIHNARFPHATVGDESF